MKRCCPRDLAEQVAAKLVEFVPPEDVEHEHAMKVIEHKQPRPRLDAGADDDAGPAE